MYKVPIGTRNESSLHRTLKLQYTGPDGRTEAEVGKYIADGINASGEYIEVQTGSFGPLKEKVKDIAANGKVRIIHPIAVSKIIEVYAENGKFLYRRKSPKKGSIWHIFNALIYAPQLPLVKRVIIEVVMADITEKRIKNGKGSWRRRGISIHDKELSVWHGRITFGKPADYLRFIPFKKGEEFTVSSLAKQAGIESWTARKALYVLTIMKIVKRIHKKNQAWVYVR
jgi:hypothetical protein